MNKTLEKILQVGMDDFKFISENQCNPNSREWVLKDYLDYDLSVVKEIADETEDKELAEQCERYIDRVIMERFEGPTGWPGIIKFGNELFCNIMSINGGVKTVHRGALEYDKDFSCLVCTECGKCYSIEDAAKADTLRSYKWLKIKKGESEYKAKMQKKPLNEKAAMDAYYDAVNRCLREMASPTPERPGMYVLVDLYIVPSMQKNNSLVAAFHMLHDMHGRRDFNGCNHTQSLNSAVYKKDDIYLCAICGKAVSAEDVEKRAKEIDLSRSVLGGARS